MLSEIIKYYFIFYNGLYIYLKITNTQITSKLYINITKLFPILLSFLTYIFEFYNLHPSYVLPLLILWIILAIFTSTPKETLISTIISFGISYSFYAVACAIALLSMSIFYYSTSNFPYWLLAIISSSIQTFLCINLCKFKRFKKGMPFLLNKNIINIGTILCLVLFTLSIYVTFNHSHRIEKLLGLFSFVYILAFLIHWWQAQITKSYKQSLVMRELDSLRIEVEEKDKEISRLKVQNEELGRLIHHDNKRIPAMETAVCEYLVSDFNDIDAMKERANVLRLEIESLSRNRSNTLKEIYSQKSKIYSTGISSLNTLLNYMDKRASDAGIQFNVHNTLKLETYIPKHISEEDLTHVLSDLLENAIIAIEHCNNKAIQLQFYVSEKHFVIEVADSGIPFEAKSIVNFGLSKLTTHEDTGGSGIGLMDIWEIKENCGASLHIEEYELPAPFTKKLSMIFNHKNMYSVRTYRAEEITTLSKRNDLRVYTFND